jgi:sulfate transporter 4
MPTAVLITGVAILESVGIAKALAAKNGYELDSNKELFGLGIANICGSFFSSYPATGSFSRSAVNHESGARTGLSGIIMGIIICGALLFMTPLFTDIPQVSNHWVAQRSFPTGTLCSPFSLFINATNSVD